MNENTKTLIFVLAAVGILLVAWAVQPRLPEERPQEEVGQLLVPEFDPRSTASLEIVKYDEKEARIETFEVTHNKQKGGWSIPSHDNYPADAKEHLAEAAITFTNVKILDVAAEDPGDHKQYGVLDPDPRDPREGMGTKVIMKDKEGKELVALIIGKQASPPSSGQSSGPSELRYVRRVGDDRVFVAAVNIDRLSTKFEDWIEKDLLKLNPWDIKEVEIQDYSVDIVRGMIIQRGQMTLEYNDTGDPRWKLVQDLQAAEKGLQQLGLGPEEELNTAKLDDMKFALDDLKIVDVNPKPAGLSADLKAEETLITNREAVTNLAARGFYPAQVEGRYEIVSNEGQIRVLMKDGVEYLLRFGGPAGTGKAEEKQAPKSESKPKEKSEDQKTSPGMNRFIMVTARFNESAIPKPQLEPLPEDTSEKPSAEAKSESKPASASPKEKPESKPESKPSEKTDPAKQEKTEPKKDPEQTKKELEQRRQEIQKENERKQKEYQEKLEQGRKRAKELNDRFADWYYIISEETYKKIRLTRSDIVKKKEEKKEEPKEAEHKHEHEAQPKEGEKTPLPASTKQEPKSEEPKPSMEAKPGVSQPSPESKPSESKPAPAPADKPAPAPAASKPTPAGTEASKPPAAEPATPKPTPSNP